jgi:AcrR family transcriptional regulator
MSTAAKQREDTHGRVKQRRRTRTAIVQAAMTLLARGESPSVAAVADAAEVSRRTVYMYFPTLDQLLIDATAGLLGQNIEARLADATLSDDVEGRLELLARSTQNMSPEVERLGRALISLTVQQRADAPASADAPAPAGKPRRGYRRVQWIEQALAPVKSELSPRRFERLVSALAMVIGWEALIVLRDIRGLTAADSASVTVWAAHALLHAMLAEQRAATSGDGRRRATR